MELILRLAKIPRYGQPKPCQTCKIFDSYTLETNPMYNWMPSSYRYCTNMWTLLSRHLWPQNKQRPKWNHDVRVFQKKHMVNTLKSQRRTFYTIISIAKSTLYSLYYRQSGRITESRVCKIFSSYLTQVRIIPCWEIASNTFKLWNKIYPNQVKTVPIFCTQEKLITARIKKEAHNILCLESYKKNTWTKNPKLT